MKVFFPSFYVSYTSHLKKREQLGHYYLIGLKHLSVSVSLSLFTSKGLCIICHHGILNLHHFYSDNTICKGDLFSLISHACRCFLVFGNTRQVFCLFHLTLKFYSSPEDHFLQRNKGFITH